MYPYSKIIAINNSNIWEKLLSWYQNSIIKELTDYLSEQVFQVDFRVYDNFTVGAGTEATVRNVILGLMIGMIVAACAMAYTRRVHGRFVRTLLRRGALSPDTAITLRETGLFRNPSVRRALLGGAVSKLTRCVETEAYLAARDVPTDDASNAEAGADSPSDAEATAPAEPGSDTEYASEEAHGEGDLDSQNGTEKAPAVRGLVVVDGFTPDLLTARFYIPEELKYRAEVRYERRGSGIPQLILTTVACVAAAILLCRFLPSILQLADNLINVFS